MKNSKENGITLIALIVTIIVLLILAGVSISVLSGENGILQQASSAKEKSDQASIMEQLTLAVLSAKTAGNGDIDLDTLQTELYSLGYEGAVTLLPADLEIDGYHFAIAEDGTVSIATWYYAYDENEKIYAVTNGTTILEIGDTVNYEPEDGLTYTSEESANGYGEQEFSSTYTGEWAVLGVSGGEILLMNTTNIQTTSSKDYYLGGQTGYVNAESELDKICSIYGTGTGASGARSVKAEDINRITGYNPNNVGVYGSLSVKQWNKI